jgi:hypothetical protein
MSRIVQRKTARSLPYGMQAVARESLKVSTRRPPETVVPRLERRDRRRTEKKTTMRRFGILTLGAVAAALFALPVAAQPAGGGAQRVAPRPAGKSPAQERLMARRAAIVDAQRQLGEIVRGTWIESNTYVRDFVTERDEIAARFNDIIKGAREVDSRTLPNGIVEVDVVVDVRSIQQLLGRPIPYWETEFRATGAGAIDGNGQQWLLARRAAILDAQRQLGEMIKGVQVSSNTYVRDFVTERDEISSRMSTVMQGAEVVAVREMPDGTVEVDMAMPAARVQWMMGQPIFDPNATLQVTGTGVPRGPVATPPPAPAAPEFELMTISATGSGVCPPGKEGTPQGVAMAKRAAKLDAMRNLGENVLGVQIDSSTYVRDFVTENDEVRSRFNGFLQGSRVVDEKEIEPCLYEVTVEIKLTNFGQVVLTGRR